MINNQFLLTVVVLKILKVNRFFLENTPNIYSDKKFINKYGKLINSLQILNLSLQKYPNW